MSNWEDAPIVSGSWQDAPVVKEPEPRTLSEKVFRGLGLGARYLTETPGLTVAGLADIGSTGVNYALQARSWPRDPLYQLPTNRAQMVREGFTQMGFPEPEGDLERAGERISRGVVAAGFGPATGRAIAGSPNPVTANVGRVLTEEPGIQGASAITAGASGAVAEKAGLGPKGQMAAEVVGGMVAPASVAATRAATGAGRTALGVKDVLTKSGQRKIVGNVMDDAAINAERAAKNIADEQAFGSGISAKTTGQASKDTGLLTLERAARAMDTRGRFGQQLSQANTRRQRILDVIGGGDLKAAKAARDVTTGAQREAAFAGAKPIQIKPVLKRIDDILASPQGKRKIVRQAMDTYRKELDGIDDARTLYEIRKDINDAMQGKFSRGDRSDFKLAKMELKSVKNAIDETIESSAPGFKKYLEDYARLSRDIDRRGIIQNIQKRSTVAASDPSTGRDILSQARFKRMVDVEIQNGILTDEQLTVLKAIADDLDSGQAINSATVRPPGSDTAKNLTVAHILGRATGGQVDSPLITNLARPLRWLSSLSEDQVQGLLVDAMLDPKLAAQLLSEASPAQISRLSTSLKTLAGASTAGTALEIVPQTREQQQ